jgi:hypothetical protein
MPLKRINLRPGFNQEVTSYANEGGWLRGDKVRFRSLFPEKIGGWLKISNNHYLGICRSVWAWTTLSGSLLRGVGTHLKFYLERGGEYFDITPIRDSESLTDPFDTVSGESIVTVTDAAGGYVVGDFVTFSGATAVGGITISGEYQILSVSGTTYTIESGVSATSTANGGGSVTADYQINVGSAVAQPLTGWGSGSWGSGLWGIGGSGGSSFPIKLRIWNQSNFGQDLVFGPSMGAVYYWPFGSLSTRGVLLSSRPGASDVPLVHNLLLVSDISRFVFVFGTNELGQTDYDPLLVRWSDQENAANWTPSATNQAGGIRLSRGSSIVAVRQARQEILVWTDSALYSFQYVGGIGIVWSTQIVGENITIVSSRAVAYASGVAFWMGAGRFYTYDGRTQILPCSVKRFVFNDFNMFQRDQVFAGTNEEFNEIWWFYCSKDSTEVNRYVIYNYVDEIWYFGELGRTAWLDSCVCGMPLAATYNYNLVEHEQGVDDLAGDSPEPIAAYVESSYFGMDEGDNFSFAWRVLPDLTFEGSTTSAPGARIVITPSKSSGSGYTAPPSVGLTNTADVVRSAVAPVERYTEQVPIRVRGRQFTLRVESEDLGVTWQLGSPRFDFRPDGRR